MAGILYKKDILRMAEMLAPGEEILAVGYMRTVPNVWMAILEGFWNGPITSRDMYLVLTTSRALFMPLSKLFYKLDMENKFFIPYTLIKYDDQIIYVQQGNPEKPLKLILLSAEGRNTKLKRPEFVAILDQQKNKPF